MNKFQKKHIVSSFECDSRLRLRIRSLFNLFQDLADIHANEMGLGYRYCHERQLAWIGAGYHVRIHRLPRWEEEITLSTWPSEATSVAGIRDFCVTDKSNHKLIVASSMWIVLDLNRMRPVSVAKHMPAYELFPERALESDFSKPTPLTRVDDTRIFNVHADEIDLYNHVNNAVYPTWILDAFDEAFLTTHELSELKITFKNPAKRQDQIVMETQIEGPTTRHVIRSNDGKIFADITALWRYISD